MGCRCHRYDVGLFLTAGAEAVAAQLPWAPVRGAGRTVTPAFDFDRAVFEKGPQGVMDAPYNASGSPGNLPKRILFCHCFDAMT